MSSPRLLILGTHLLAEEVADLVAQSADQVLAGFVENWDRTRCTSRLLGWPVIWVDDVAGLATDHVAVCAIGTTRRYAYIEQVETLGLSFTRVMHPSTILSATAELGVGCIVSAGVVVAARTRIGAHVILNRGVLVGHHTTIGDCVTISPGANIAGCARIGDRAYVGMGAIVLDRISIGAGAIVGAGSVVTRDVPARTQVVGVPARVVKEDVDPR
jgi:sugar O-acyltransferase (sialic acid O-acetyltransferase NeuD family)